ncbi:MAG: LOG family protein, partial [Acidimicrobiia bacterium]
MPVVAVFGSSSAEPGAPDYEDARRLGRLLAEAGVAVATGGYGGLMEAVSSGAHQAGGRVIGVTVPTVFPDRPAANPFVGEERRAESLTERIHQLTDLAEAAIALP